MRKKIKSSSKENDFAVATIGGETRTREEAGISGNATIRGDE